MFAKKVTVSLGLLLVGSLFNSLSGQAASEGLYTADQAKRGAAIYQAQCALCHGSDLAGVGQAPPLSGNEFLANYQGESILALFDKIHKSMPATSPGSLTRPQTADVLSYILSSNKYFAGTTELPSDEDGLKKIQLVKP